jgi:hypothetical protein
MRGDDGMSLTMRQRPLRSAAHTSTTDNHRGAGVRCFCPLASRAVRKSIPRCRRGPHRDDRQSAQCLRFGQLQRLQPIAKRV